MFVHSCGGCPGDDLSLSPPCSLSPATRKIEISSALLCIATNGNARPLPLSAKENDYYWWFHPLLNCTLGWVFVVRGVQAPLISDVCIWLHVRWYTYLQDLLLPWRTLFFWWFVILWGWTHYCVERDRLLIVINTHLLCSLCSSRWDIWRHCGLIEPCFLLGMLVMTFLEFPSSLKGALTASMSLLLPPLAEILRLWAPWEWWDLPHNQYIKFFHSLSSWIFSIFVQERVFVRRCGVLHLGSILWGNVRMRQVLSPCRNLVAELLPRFPNIACHEQVYSLLIVIPIKVKSNVLFTVPILSDVKIILQNTHGMSCVFSTHTLYSKVVDH